MTSSKSSLEHNGRDLEGSLSNSAMFVARKALSVAAIAATETAFRETSIAELLSDPSRSRPLCSCDDFDEVASRTRLK